MQKLRRSVRMTSITMAVSASWILLAGCESPRASVSSPLVYTSTVWKTAEAELPEKATFSEGLRRYFGMTQADYEKERLRIDAMLDNTQRQSAFFEQIQTMTELRLAANLFNQTAPTTLPSALPSSNDRAKSIELIRDLFEKARARTAAAGVLADSPFDQLDRVSDFYGAFLLKYLRMKFPVINGTSDALLLATASDSSGRPGTVTGVLSHSGLSAGNSSRRPAQDQPVPECDGTVDRHILLYLQAHVSPGNQTNEMVELKIEPISAKAGSTKIEGEDFEGIIRIVRLHPTRFYDMDNVAFGQSMEEAASIAAQITAPIDPTTGLSMEVKRTVNKQREIRREFLTRVQKQSSYVDAGGKSFGWRFYPSNLSIQESSFIGLLLKLIFPLDGDPDFKIVSTLEGGGRDCAVYLTVPRNLKQITFQSSSRHASIFEGFGGPLSGWKDAAKFTVDLPDWDPSELKSGENKKKTKVSETKAESSK